MFGFCRRFRVRWVLWGLGVFFSSVYFAFFLFCFVIVDDLGGGRVQSRSLTLRQRTASYRHWAPGDDGGLDALLLAEGVADPGQQQQALVLQPRQDLPHAGQPAEARGRPANREGGQRLR